MVLSPRIPLGSSIGLLIFTLSLTTLGCGPATGTVTGKVTYNNVPLKGGMVTFINDKKEALPPAEIQEDGHYTLKKVRLGEYKITVETESLRPPDPHVLNSRPKDVQGGPNFEERAKRYMKIPDNYRDPDQSRLTYTVISGTQDHEIPLK